MKKITLVLSLLLSVFAFAQAPEAINYQGIARNSSGTALISQPLGLRLSIHSGNSTGPIVYQEIFGVSTNTFGLYNVKIGRGTPINGSFNTISWGTLSHFLEVEMDITGGTNYVPAGTSELISVPYALYAKTSGNGQGPIGPTGPQGDTGSAGPAGPQGPQGNTGPAGIQGPPGDTGAVGPQGVAGPAGPQGVAGATGPQGVAGTTGPQGIAGATGSQGIAGATGPQGVAGPAGPQGIAGATGSQGIAGATGPQGIAGATGPQGIAGATGPQGIAGATGPQGVAGATGPQGVAGATGPTGAPDPNGWLITGNGNTTSGVNFLGTTNNEALEFRTNNITHLRITTSGRLDVLNTGKSVIIGDSAGLNSPGGDVLIGHNAGRSISLSNTQVTAIGTSALKNNTTGINNTAVGFEALYSNTTNGWNTAFGFKALRNSNGGNDNTAVGMGAMEANTGGSYNVAFGYESLVSNTNGDNNVALGRRALRLNTTGHENTASGSEALHSNTTGLDNTASGFGALYASTTGSHNASFGYKALNLNITGMQNTGVGSNTNVSSGALNNATAIGYGSIVNASNKIRFGNTTVTVVEGPVAYTISDGRFKDNVTENDVKGLEFIKRLRPVVYNFDSRRFEEFLTKNMPDSVRSKYLEGDFSKSTAIRQSGFIAQEVEAAAKASGYDFNGVHAPENENDNYSLAYGQFVVPLVKGMQEQQQMIEQLKAELQELKTQLAASTGNTDNNTGTLQVFPNPAKGLVTITTPIVTSGTIAICSLDGKTLLSQVIVPGTTVQQLDLTTQAKGVYLVHAISEGKVIGTQKLIIE